MIPSIAPSLIVAWLQAVTIPAPTGLVNDFASVIPADHEARIERLATTVRTRSPGELAVVTLPDIGDRDPSEIALRIGREWGVGKTGEAGDPARNAGVVILIVPKETSSIGRGYCRVEVGRGAEGYITDGTAASICREATPAFVARDYGTGIELVAARVAERFAAEFGFSDDTTIGAMPPVGAPAPTFSISWWLPFLILFIVINVMRNAARAPRRHGRGGRRGGSTVLPIPFPIILPRGGGWGGGGGFGGGGFGGFGGGGGFSGGGGGSSW